MAPRTRMQRTRSRFAWSLAGDAQAVRRPDSCELAAPRFRGGRYLRSLALVVPYNLGVGGP